MNPRTINLTIKVMPGAAPDFAAYVIQGSLTEHRRGTAMPEGAKLNEKEWNAIMALLRDKVIPERNLGPLRHDLTERKYRK